MTDLKELMENVSDNPAQIKWPSDQWGFTTEVKKAISSAAGRLGGSQDKHDLLIATLMVALAHVKKRHAKDVRVRAERLGKIKQQQVARQPLERFHAYK